MSLLTHLRTLFRDGAAPHVVVESGAQDSRAPESIPRAFYAARVSDREVSEFLGICKGIILDGNATDNELRGLHDWAIAHPEAAFRFPCRPLTERLLAAIADGVVDESERSELQTLLYDVVGQPDSRPTRDAASRDASTDSTTRVAFDDPLPAVVFPGREYALTGVFAFGTRAAVRESIESRGGVFGANCTRRTSYLVVGTLGSEAWLQSTHGRKMERAYELKRSGMPIYVIPEEHWYAALAHVS